MKLFSFLVIVSLAIPSFAQEPSQYDFGRMWTFENPPKAWFKEAYHFDADDEWFNEARKASLRFATWCSASFVSPDGLVMTNHHCSRGEVGALMRDGEDFDKQGFYAVSLRDERRAEGLFVEQLLRTEDITDKVKAITASAQNDEERAVKTTTAFQQIQSDYGQRPGWEDLRLQIVTYYSGGRFSIYGYKRYNDIRLVFIPELDLGFYGGDPDNFTYPRYCLDYTFWRVYDDNGQPLNTRDNYFKFNEAGVNAGEPVFVIGNPGNTERYRTVSQLEYDRDYRYPVQLAFMRDRYALMEEEYARNPSHELQEEMFNFSNSIKAMTGIQEGLENPELFGRKVAMEKKIRSVSGKDYWDQLTTAYNAMGPQLAELQFLSPNPEMMGNAITLLHQLYAYKNLAEENEENPDLEAIEEEIKSLSDGLNTTEQQVLLAAVLGELKQFADPGDTYIDEILDGRTPEIAAQEILDETCFAKAEKLERLLDKKPKKIAKEKDVLMDMADVLMPRHYAAIEYYQRTSPTRRAHEQKVVSEVFKVYGSNLPPDATFTLRISDGVVKTYEYNGTIAPYKTTFFGLYDRHYSNDMMAPWALPDRWKNPSLDLLKAPLNFISTADIIGGNSGSPVINKNQEVVGLVFDGNIESLPGNFIFDEEKNRTVAVHAGGILAALRYVYKADRLLTELMQ
ncbi:MAG TPA: S46 family peptidase [Saprospiraceae bacterium]|nr:S46 family peptidase [Saprospiraceae bacterium]